MERETIIRMAREAEGEEELHGMWSMHVEDLERFAALVAAAEREACARIAETAFPFHCEDLIRARGDDAYKSSANVENVRQNVHDWPATKQTLGG